MLVKTRLWFGIVLLLAGVVMLAQGDAPAGTCGRWFVFGNGVGKIRHLMAEGNQDLLKLDWRAASEKFVEAAGQCEDNVGYYLAGRASQLASYALERYGDVSGAIRMAERAERQFFRIKPSDPNHLVTQQLLQDVRSRLARLRPLDPLVVANLLPPPPVFPGALWPSVAVGLDPRSPGSLNIETSPPRAAIVLNGRWKGRSPLSLKDVEPGEYLLSVKKKGYRTESRTIRVVPGGSVRLGISLKRFLRTAKQEKKERRSAHGGRSKHGQDTRSVSSSTGSSASKSDPTTTGKLIVESNPSSLMVRVNGVDRGRSPLVLDRLSPGPLQVVVGDMERKGRFRSFTIEVRSGETHRLYADLSGLMARDAIFALGGGTEQWEETGGRFSVMRVAYLATPSQDNARRISELVPLSELPEFLRNGSVIPGGNGPGGEIPENLFAKKKPKKALVAQTAAPPERKTRSWWSVLLSIGMIGLGLISVTGAYLGWRKKKALGGSDQETSNGAEGPKIRIEDLEELKDASGEIPADGEEETAEFEEEATEGVEAEPPADAPDAPVELEGDVEGLEGIAESVLEGLEAKDPTEEDAVLDGPLPEDGEFTESGEERVLAGSPAGEPEEVEEEFEAEAEEDDD